MSFKIVTLKWYHGGELIIGPFSRYVGGSQTLTLDVDVDRISFFELMDYTREMGLVNVAELYICPMDRIDKLINVLTDKDILDICNQLEDGDTLEIYVTHAAPIEVLDPDENGESVCCSKASSKRPIEVQDDEEVDDEDADDIHWSSDSSVASDDGNASDGAAENSSTADDVVSDDAGKQEEVDIDWTSDSPDELGEGREKMKRSRRKRSEKPKGRGDINMDKAGVDIGFDELRTGSKQHRIGKMREFCETWICDISPIAMKIYQDNLAKSMKCTPRWNGETGYEIEDTKYKHVSGGQNPRVISTGTNTKRSTASTEECAYQPRSADLRWMGKKAISTRQLQRNVASKHNLSQASSSSQPTKKQKKK
ncbi:hypothetical protein A4A49_40667 [Nicotiana attenuata]|uniref:PB1-like domain-containing protein n=1 Tax=Nicotiana attenuata TaxID=49451 RepID=A0A1J6KC77_NICAT|nr:hypothetical protein A4A49_40667 [Nicotiana attenuata]